MSAPEEEGRVDAMMMDDERYIEGGGKGQRSAGMVGTSAPGIRRFGWFMPLVVMLSFMGAGCASRPAPQQLTLDAKNYDAVFSTTLNTLRDMRFEPDRIDSRLGVITTRPRSSASFAEPWRDDNATVEQALESTVNFQRRLIRIEFTSAEASTPEGMLTNVPDSATIRKGPAQTQVGPPAPLFQPGHYTGQLVMTVRCFVQRQNRPGYQVDPVAVRLSSFTTDPELARRGVPYSFWETIARDGLMEERLRRGVHDQAEAITALIPSGDDASINAVGGR